MVMVHMPHVALRVHQLGFRFVTDEKDLTIILHRESEYLSHRQSHRNGHRSSAHLALRTSQIVLIPIPTEGFAEGRSV